MGKRIHFRYLSLQSTKRTIINGVNGALQSKSSKLNYK